MLCDRNIHHWIWSRLKAAIMKCGKFQHLQWKLPHLYLRYMEYVWGFNFMICFLFPSYRQMIWMERIIINRITWTTWTFEILQTKNTTLNVLHVSPHTTLYWQVHVFCSYCVFRHFTYAHKIRTFHHIKSQIYSNDVIKWLNPFSKYETKYGSLPVVMFSIERFSLCF